MISTIIASHFFVFPTERTAVEVYYGCCDDRRARRPYGCFSFLFDVFMTALTGGLWLIYIFVREMRRR